MKNEFANWVTGKLSDVSGLFIFPLFLTALFPKRVQACFIITAMIFIFWKLPTSNFLIQFLNDSGLSVGRVIDLSDLTALGVLPFAYYYRKSSFQTFKLNPHVLVIISLFAFFATSRARRQVRKYVSINKTYNFDFSRNILIGSLNRITIKKIKKESLFTAIQFDSEGDFFYYKWSSDTLAIMLDSKLINNNDTIHYKTVLADFVISGNDSISSLKFINAYKVVLNYSDEDYREKAIREFEKKVVKKIKNNHYDPLYNP